MAGILIPDGSALTNPQRMREFLSTQGAESHKAQGIVLVDSTSAGNALDTYTRPSGTQAGLNVYGGSQTTEGPYTVSAAAAAGAATAAAGTYGGSNDMTKTNNVGVLIGSVATAGSVLVFEASPDGGTTWLQVPMRDEQTQQPVWSVTIAANTPRVLFRAFGSFTRFRVRCSTFVASSTPAILIDPGTFPWEPMPAAINMNPAGAVNVSYATAAAGVGQATTTEALDAMTGQRDGSAIGSASTFTVPAGKTFRILGFTGWARNGAATATMMAIKIRALKSGTVAANTGFEVITLLCPMTNAVGATNRDNFTAGSSFIELLSGWSWAVSAVLGVASAATVMGASVYGIEY